LNSENNNNPLGLPTDEIANISEDNDIYKKLPDELIAKGWILNKNELKIPIHESENYLAIKYENEKYNYYFSTKEKRITKILEYKEFIDIDKKVRTKELIKYGKAKNIPIDETFLDIAIIDNLLESDIEISNILKENYQIANDLTENIETIEDKFKYRTFEDYPENTQKQAIEIIKNNEFFNYLLNSVSWKHKGDKETAILLFLSMATIYIKEPVHQILNAPTGKGKTDIFNRVKETQPEQYLIDLVSFSVKSLYYGKNFILNNKYNILVIDDVKFTKDIIELLKLLLDNERTEKIHRTVIDSQYKEMKLEGYFLGLINRAKDDLDSELANRCYLNSLKDNEDYEVKNRIKINNLIDVDSYNDRFNLILKCCYQYLIDKEITVYNPMLLFLDIKEHENRNIGHYMNLSKGMTFYNYDKRKTIDNLTIGSYEDIANTLNIVSQDFQVQKDKLTDSEKRIIDELENNKENNTNKLLANVIGLHHETIGRIIRGRDNQVGLETKGYIKKELVDKGSYHENEYTLLKSYKNSLNDDLIYQLPRGFIWLMSKNPLLIKKAILINYISHNHIIVNRYIEKKINTFLENNSYELENYSNLCLMLENFNNFIKNDENIIYLNSDFNITSEMFIQHDKILKKINDKIFFLLGDFRGKNLGVSKPKETALNQKQRKNNPQHNKNTRQLRTKKTDKDLRKFIQKEIYEVLNIHGSLIKSEIIKNIPTFEKEQDSNYYIISKEIDFLLDTKGLLDKLDNDKYTRVYPDFEDYYNENLKELEYEA